MNLYRGCQHGCVYCDGRAERYFVFGDFERDITVKGNAASVLAGELARRKEPGFVLLGGGVSDAYQPAERRFKLARGVLEVVKEHALPVHVLTKSTLVERDFDLLSDIHSEARVIVSMSVQSVDDEVRRRFEPGASSIPRRLETLRRAKARGFGVGVMAMPVLPGVSDQPEAIDALFLAAREAGADFVCGGGLTLRVGAQKSKYLEVIERFYPRLVRGYRTAYRVERSSGAPEPTYLQRVDARFSQARNRHGVAGRIPHALFSGLMPQYAEVGVLMEHRAFALRKWNSDAPRTDWAAAGAAIQRWARTKISSQGRRKGFTYLGLQGEFQTLCESGELHRVIPMSPDAAEEAHRLLKVVLDLRRRNA